MRIALYAFDGITMFHLAAPLMVFGEVTRLGLAPDWETRVWSDRAGSIRTEEGFPVGDIAGPDTVDWADIVIVTSWPESLPHIGKDLSAALSDAHSRGAEIAGLCLGSFAVADTGLLAGRPAVTHWTKMTELRERNSHAGVDESVLYIDHGDVMTSAGTASSIDSCLHIVRKHLGSAAATRVARSLVVAPHRDGGQAQYIERPVTEASGGTAIADVLSWALERLDEPLPIERLAEHACMSRRSFIRQFQLETGATPARWVLDKRLNEARSLLETTDHSIDKIADACGFGSAVTLRQNFRSAFAVTPTAYRRQFTVGCATTSIVDRQR
ncbi:MULTISPECIES: GlxA family transcriptional regulator [unclassified Rhodococcus (in: high G+C Gram-positive bacteria)]|uniref:GlxA family transcriptional regulator n=1 Tax=unclassified Rhodococcus (in: high G+C Gram-positive bacteria) TaxID=192944 RepID=UPI0007BB850C|nr:MULTISPECIES: helix-turn-helix domain-containing protein [unclassified Rhodococcus (in: high G+C Gram-positive bacteria)]KZF09345.1 AraC family transcriptional regulator [Rhodococcus sp. EPR-147]KZF11860.1 AraC family transcriptional regulator [Rhodococcus sp. EPR-279]